jgi:hypothetical protein
VALSKTALARPHRRSGPVAQRREKSKLATIDEFSKGSIPGIAVRQLQARSCTSSLPRDKDPEYRAASGQEFNSGGLPMNEHY